MSRSHRLVPSMTSRPTKCASTEYLVLKSAGYSRVVSHSERLFLHNVNIVIGPTFVSPINSYLYETGINIDSPAKTCCKYAVLMQAKLPQVFIQVVFCGHGSLSVELHSSTSENKRHINDVVIMTSHHHVQCPA